MSSPHESKQQPPPSLWAIVAAYATIYLVWGSTYLAIRIAVETLPPFLMAGVRFLLAGAIVAIYLACTSGFSATWKQWRDNAWIGGLLLLGGTGLVCWAEEDVPSGIATLVVSLSPLFVVLADWGSLAWFKDGKRGSKPNGLTLIGLAIGFVGLGLLVGPTLTEEGNSGLDVFRVAALVFACLFWAIGSLWTRYVDKPTNPFVGASIQMLCGGVWLIAVSLLVGEHREFEIQAVSLNSFLAWLYLVIAGSIVAFTTYIWLMKHSSPIMVSTYSYVNPIVAVFLGWWILNEEVGPRIFLAAAVIVVGVALITIAKRK